MGCRRICGSFSGVCTEGSRDCMESVSGEVVLFGSYAREEARGEARGKDSDVVDLLVLPEGEVNGWQEYLKIEPVSRPLSLESGYVLSILPVTVEAYKGPRKPVITNARQERVSLV